MVVYILDMPGETRNQMVKWLSEEPRITEIKVFDNYIRLIKWVSKYPPDYCLIRLGSEAIPGFKAAVMIKNINADINFIFIADDRYYALDAFEIGAYGYILCPVAKEKLINFIN